MNRRNWMRSFLAAAAAPFLFLRESFGYAASKQPKFRGITFAIALQKFITDMNEDEGLRIAYQSNIAMRIMDNSDLSHAQSNFLADQVINLLFDVPLPDCAESCCFFPPANEVMTEGDEGYYELFGGREPA